MTRIFRIILALCLSVALLPMAQAQEDDRSRLVRLIEDSLSDGARRVRIEGFYGALSSTAALDRLTIADDDGVWLTIEGAELVWTRSALLRGALEVDRLTARRIVLDRLPPSGGDGAPTPEATPFQLPDLPVSVALGALSVERLDLGAAILGFPATLSASGSASLAGGDGAARLMLDRLDGPDGAFVLSADFANDTGLLDLTLRLTEDPGGLAATGLGLPGAPSVALEVAGQGPLDDLTVDLSLATDGTPRLEGQLVSTRDAGGEARVTAALSGDLTPLMAAEYQPFFGTNSTLDAVIARDAAGGTVLEDFTLRTFSLNLTGSAALAADNTPMRFDVTGLISDPTGRPVRLPVPGARVTLTGADLALTYDRAEGDEWTARGTVTGVETDTAGLAQATLVASGTITPPDRGPVAVTFDVETVLTGLSHDDPSLQSALGQTARLGLTGNWRDGAPFTLERLDISGDTASLDGTASLMARDGRLDTSLDLTARLPDLAPFSGLAGQDLSGAARMTLGAEADLLSGAFEAATTLTATDLALGGALPAALTRGETRIEAALARDAAGLRLDRFALAGRALTTEASGRLSSGESNLQATARLADVAMLTDALSGPVETSLTLRREAGDAPWTVNAEASGRGGITAGIAGQAGLPGGAVDLSLTGTAPLALGDRFITPRSVRGQATFDLRLHGQPGLGALSGTIRTDGARVSAPEVGLVLDGLTLDARLSGPALVFTGAATVQPAGRLGFEGGLDLAGAGLPGRLDIDLSGVRLTQGDLFTTRIARGEIGLRGQFANGPSVSGTILLDETTIRLDALSTGTGEPIPEIRHEGESAAQFATRERAGLTGTGTGGAARPLPLDLTVSAPARIFLRGGGLDAELGGEIRIGGTSAAVQPAGQFSLIRGRLSFLGQRFELVQATATLQGSLDPYLRVVAETDAGDITARVTIAGPASAPSLTVSSSPDLPQDEILARLFFGRSATSLSPVQALQLVDAVSGAAGGQGVVSGLRDRFGLADLDITTGADGEAALRIGRYLSDNVYTDLQVGTGGTSEASVNIDLTPNITARGSVSDTSDSSIGLFFERDY